MNEVFDHKSQNVSTQDWPGLTSQKWHGGRMHIKAKDQLLSNYQAESEAHRGKKVYAAKVSDIYEHRPHNRQYQGKHGNETTLEVNKTGLKHISFKPTIAKDRAERMHLQEQKSGHLEDLSQGIQTYDYANQTRGVNWGIEQKMNQKQRLHYLDEKRNYIDCKALGDKQYKNPEYSDKFFKEGGLIVGSTIKARPIKNTSEKQLVSTRVEGKLTWKERVKKDERKQEQDAVDELDDWVENVLKDANPNYVDVEELERKEKEEEEQRMKEAANPELKQDPKKGNKKDTKKGKK